MIYNDLMGIMDYVIIGAIVIFALIGLVRGGAKMFFGLFLLLIIMVGSSFLAAWACPLFLKNETDDSVTYTKAATIVMTPLEGVLPSDGDFGALLDTEVTSGPDGSYYVGEAKLSDVITEKVPYVGSFAASFVESAAHVGEPLRTTFAFKITEWIYEIVLWVNLVIALAIVRNIFRKKIYIYLDKHSGPSKLDRLIGLVFNLAILLVILWGAGALVAHFDNGSNWANTADNFMINGMIAKPLMCNNPLLKLMHITLPIE